MRVDTETTIKRVRIAEEEVMIIEEREQHAQKPTVVMQSPPVVPRDIEDDWFLLLESVPVEVQSPPSGRHIGLHIQTHTHTHTNTPIHAVHALSTNSKDYFELDYFAL